jgi:hypothetical protein
VKLPPIDTSTGAAIEKLRENKAPRAFPKEENSGDVQMTFMGELRR